MDNPIDETTSEETSGYKRMAQDSLQSLYDDQQIILKILSNLDSKWKTGLDIHEDVVELLNRYENLAFLFDYILSPESRRQEFLNDFEIENPEQIEFLDSIGKKFGSLTSPLRSFSYQRAGLKTHITRFSREGIYYDTGRNIILGTFSIYTFHKKLVTITDYIDDHIWLASALIEFSNTAIKYCIDKGLDIKTYSAELKSRLVELEECYNEYRKLVSDLEGSSPLSSGLSSEKGERKEENTNIAESVPDVEL